MQGEQTIKVKLKDAGQGKPSFHCEVEVPLSEMRHKSLLTCRREGLCYMCQEREAVTNNGLEAPMCRACKRKWWVTI